MTRHYVYVVQCADGSLYTGWTTDVDRRIAAHNSGQGAKYTRSRRPVALKLLEVYENKSEALRREVEIKRMQRREKQRLIDQYEHNQS